MARSLYDIYTEVVLGQSQNSNPTCPETLNGVWDPNTLPTEFTNSA